MFEQADIAEFDQCVLGDADAMDAMTSKSPGTALAMSLTSMRDEPTSIGQAAHPANAIFGNVWPGLVVAVC